MNVNQGKHICVKCGAVFRQYTHIKKRMLCGGTVCKFEESKKKAVKKLSHQAKIETHIQTGSTSFYHAQSEYNGGYSE